MEAEDHRQRAALADAIERESQDVVDLWLAQVSADASAAHVSPTELKDGIHDYLTRLVELLRGDQVLANGGAAVWGDVAQEHAVTRVRLGFDITQLFHELVILRRMITQVVRGQGISTGEQIERVDELLDSAISASLKSYIDFRDFVARRREAEHIGFLSHDLKNPLQAIDLASKQLCQGAVTAEQRRLCDMIDRNVRRVRGLIDELLFAEGLQVGEVPARMVDLRLGELLDDAVEQHGRAARDKGLQFAAEFDPDAVVRVDRDLTLAAVENLLDNAVKYTDAGEVELAVEHRADELVIHVHDRCGGLSPEELRVIFEPFKRVHTGKPGSGLGLAIARRAIETQGGVIRAESSPDAGCHFWFTVPQPRA